MIIVGGLRSNVYRVASGTYTITYLQYIIICDNPVNLVTIKLPAAPEDGATHIIKRGNAGAVTLDGNGKNIHFDTSVATIVLTAGKAYTVVYSSTFGKWACIGEWDV